MLARRGMPAGHRTTPYWCRAAATPHSERGSTRRRTASLSARRTRRRPRRRCHVGRRRDRSDLARLVHSGMICGCGSSQPARAPGRGQVDAACDQPAILRSHSGRQGAGAGAHRRRSLAVESGPCRLRNPANTRGVGGWERDAIRLGQGTTCVLANDRAVTGASWLDATSCFLVVQSP